MNQDMKLARTIAKRLFTRSANGLASAIRRETCIEIVENKFADLQRILSDVRCKHEDCVTSIGEATEEAIAQEDTWILEVESKFDDCEEVKFRYCKLVEAGENAKKLTDNDSLLKENAIKQSEEAQKEIESCWRLCVIEGKSFRLYVKDFVA